MSTRLIMRIETINDYHGEPLLQAGHLTIVHGERVPPGWKDVTGGAFISAEEYPEAFDKLHAERAFLRALGVTFPAPGVCHLPDFRKVYSTTEEKDVD